MKLDHEMLFAHPVLATYSDDYTDGLFGASFDVRLEDEKLFLDVEIVLECPDLVELVEEGAAGTGFYLICPRTYHNRLIEMPPGSATQELDAGQFFGTVIVRPVVWSKEERRGWTSGFLHPEYAGGVDLPDATILAVAEEQRFSVDRAQLKPFETIFTLAVSEEIPDGQFRVDPDGPKIRILASRQTKESIEAMRPLGEVGKAIVLNAVYFPCVTEVLRQFSGGDAPFANQPWFRIFTAKCAAAGIDVENCVPLDAAQHLLNSPFARLDNSKESIFQ